MNVSLEELLKQAESRFDQAPDLASLENEKAAFLGKSGSVTALLKELGKLAPEQKRERGQQINQLKKSIEALLSKRRDFFAQQELNMRLAAEKIDVTLPGRGRMRGGIHPVIQSWQRIESIFRSIGFVSAQGPEIETDWYNFTALNNPLNHPARSMQDTFYTDLKDEEGLPLLLRTHTSSMQVRYARSNPPPIKIIAPGRTYRVDSDATHSPMFHQVEGLWVDENISFASLKGIYKAFLKVFFEMDDLEIRFRPSFFPFTEPSAEIDLMFTSGPNKGRWLEICGCGQVHPEVITNFGLDPKRYIGFAFGCGIERLTMLRYGVNDLRQFYEGDLRFLKQFNN